MTVASRICVLLVCACAYLLPTHALAEPQEFDFKDPKGVNAVSFVLDSAVEPIMGMASGVSGNITFDPANVGATSGAIRVDAASVQVTHEMMTNVMQSKKWLSIAKHLTIEFSFKSVKTERTLRDNVFELEIVGDFTCRGVTKEMTIPVSVTYLPDKLAQRMHGGQGDLLVLRSQFSIKRSDFEINPKTPSEVVADEIEFRVSIVGLCPKG